MKKIFLIAAVAFTVMAHNSVAQDDEAREKLVFGVKIGGNLSNVYDSEGEKFRADAKVGLAGGAFLSIPIGKFIGVQPEVLFSQKGFKATGSVLGSNYEFKRTLNYIDVPLLFAIKPIDAITILVGPQYSYLLSRKDEFNNSFLNVQQEDDFKNENIRKNTLCFLGGVDINLKNLVIGARAGWDIQNNNGDGSSTTPRYKNAWYQLTVGYRLY
jgi:hypothetical protein